MAHPMTDSNKKMFLHMVVNRRKMVASMPTCPIRSVSLSFHSGRSQAHGDLPIAGGACFSSACFSFGAYTPWLYGLRNEKQIAINAVKPIDVPREAQMEVAASYRVVRGRYPSGSGIGTLTCPANGFFKRSRSS
jgi:hypothetical protein